MWVWTALSVNESITWISMTINKRVDNPPFRPWGTLVIIWVHVNRSAGVKMLLVSITFSIFFFLFCLLCGGGGGREREEGLLVSSWQNLSIHAIFPVLFFCLLRYLPPPWSPTRPLLAQDWLYASCVYALHQLATTTPVDGRPPSQLDVSPFFLPLCCYPFEHWKEFLKYCF